MAYQTTTVIDYMYMLCHIQLIQIDCALHYVVSAWKINKYGEEKPNKAPFVPLPDSSWSETDHATVIRTEAAEGGRWCIDTIQTWPIQLELPLTLHSCIAKHHLVLFCLQQSQLTKKTIITAVAKQKTNKAGREKG